MAPAARFIGTEDVLTTELGEALGAAALAEEAPLVAELARQAGMDAVARARIGERAARLLVAVREAAAQGSGLDDFLQRYGLDTQEGVLLMCLAEALLRIPDAPTADALIADRVGRGDWRAHLDDSASLFVNASTWGLMLTGALLAPDPERARQPWQWLRSVVARLGEPVARAALGQALRILGRQFVFGGDVGEALERAAESHPWECHSFDMLGEGALDAADARRHAQAYQDAIAAVGARARATGSSTAGRDSVSIKLSALHPRYELAQRERVMRELAPLLGTLAQQAAQSRIGLTIDAEECDRLELSLQLFARLLDAPAAGAASLGLAVQAYQKRAPVAIDWLAAQLRQRRRRASVRLVKGAYWDSEIKRAQLAGLADYPVFTRKLHTDVAYLACARRLHGHRACIESQFATHNAHTVAWIVELFGAEPLEFQRLHGMGESLYAALCSGREDARGADHGPRCRVYAPVGPQSELLPYLVRRLLENGANTSFVHRAVDRTLPLQAVLRDPVEVLAEAPVQPGLPPPVSICGPGRLCASGVDLSDTRQWRRLREELETAAAADWRAQPLIDGQRVDGEWQPLQGRLPAAPPVGAWVASTAADVARAAHGAARALPEWDARGGPERAEILEQAASLFEDARGALLARCVREAGRTVSDSLGEWREAIDLLRYYAQQARLNFAAARALPGAEGELNRLRWRARGVFACISPWNFPLAIFTGQIAAALAAGNTVLAKPAEQTPLTAAYAVELLQCAGVPPDVLHLLPGDGAVGTAMLARPEVAGVAFTGSEDTALRIARQLAQRPGPIAALIAETGGLNVLLADSSALLPQLAADALSSAFNSAGQRCSAARVLCVQRDIHAELVRRLAGAMDELVLGDPALLATDVGPVIDEDALRSLHEYAGRLRRQGRIVHRARAPAGGGLFFAPLLASIERLDDVPGEVFGPILHVLPFHSDALPALLQQIDASGYGLTLGIHTRIESRAEWIAQRLRVGNVYVNRNMIGAVVGMQPFGGCGRSGTGPKAGGPSYLTRFAVEQSISVNSAAVGGNAALLSRS